MFKTKWIIFAGVSLLLVLVGVTIWLRVRSAPESDLIPAAPVVPVSHSVTSTQESRAATTTGLTVIRLSAEELRKKQEELQANQDSDSDGLNDAEETRLGLRSQDSDSDDDGFFDGEEVRFLKTDPLKADNKQSIMLLVDGFPASPVRDIFLFNHREPPGVSVMTSPPATPVDSDGDGLTDEQEINTYRTDPQKADTDGDTYPDAEEIKNGYNPLGEGRLKY